MDNLRNNERNLISFRQHTNYINQNNQNNQNDSMPKHLTQTRDFDKNLYETGKQWHQNGLPISGANEELRRNMSFVKGYNKDNQLSRITNRKV